MALRNRQDGKVEIFVGTEKVDGISKNIIEFDELALKTDITGVNSGTNTGDETKAGLITKLGIPTAVDDAAAALLEPAVAVGGLYYTGAAFQVRIA